MNATAAWNAGMGPRDDSPQPAPEPVPEKLPPREPVVPVKLRRTLKKVFGLRALRPGQAEVIDRVLAGQSTLAVMPTGAGKSLCYQLPAVLSDALTVVISPLIALMKDQCDTLNERGVPAVQLHSALDANRRLEGEALLTRGAVRVVFTTPERLADTRTLGLLQEQRVGLLVVDEAHCIAQWGHDFRPAFSALRDARRALGRPPVLALTATASAPVQRQIREALEIPRDGVLCHGVYRPNLRLAVELPQTEKERREFILRRVRGMDGGAGSAIVYCATVREATALHRQLREADVPAGLYHGKLPKAEREAAQEAFMSDTTRVMVATNAFGMGIDKADIRLVLHAQMPASIEAYVQECGRAGRDGEPADCVLLFREGDRALQQFFTSGHVPSREELGSVWRALASHTPQGGWLPAALAEVARLPQRRLDQVLAALRSVRAVRGGGEAEGLKPATRREAGVVVEAAEAALQQRRRQDRDGLEAMVLYAKAGNCRWAAVLAHFGETLEDGATRCGHCDSCFRFEALLSAEREDEAASDMQPTRQRAFEPGQRVRVRRFGWGEVQDCSADAVSIRFPQHGLRQIHPDFVLATARG